MVFGNQSDKREGVGVVRLRDGQASVPELRRWKKEHILSRQYGKTVELGVKRRRQHLGDEKKLQNSRSAADIL